MNVCRLTRIAIAGLLLTAGSSFAATVDWSKSQPFDEPLLEWVVKKSPGGATAAFGQPEADNIVIILKCDGGRAIKASRPDSGFEPYSAYAVHLRAGTRQAQTPATTQERWDLDDLVELNFQIPNAPEFMSALKASPTLDLVVQGRGSFLQGIKIPLPRAKLAPFFKSCGL